LPKFRFNRHPLVEVSVVCEGSPEFASHVSAGARELAPLTDHPGLQGLELLLEQPLVRPAAERFRVEQGAPIPLALSATTCIGRREADAAPAAVSRAARGLFFSKNYSAI